MSMYMCIFLIYMRAHARTQNAYTHYLCVCVLHIYFLLRLSDLSPLSIYCLQHSLPTGVREQC